MTKVPVVALLLLSIMCEVFEPSVSFVRAHVGGHAKLAADLTAHNDGEDLPRIEPKQDLKQRRFMFQMDQTVGTHLASVTDNVAIEPPEPFPGFGFHSVDGPPLGISWSIFQPPKST